MLEFIISNFYILAGIISISAYIPQFLKLLNAKAPPYDISIRSWTIWAFKHTVCLMYGYVVLEDALFFLLSFFNLGFLVVIIALIIQNRYVRYGDRENFGDAVLYYYGQVIWLGKRKAIC